MGESRALPAGAVGSPYLDTAAKLASLLAKRSSSDALSTNIFLNINLPNLPLAKIRGVKITRLASGSHTDTVDEGHDGRRTYYWLVRQKINKDLDNNTDIWAIEQGNISITPLRTILSNTPSPPILDSLPSDLLQELKLDGSSPA